MKRVSNFKQRPAARPVYIVSKWDAFVIWCLETGLYRPRGRR